MYPGTLCQFRTGANTLMDRLMHFSDDSEECAKAYGSIDLRIVGAHWPFWLHFLKPSPENLASHLHLVFEAHQMHLTGNQVRSQILLEEEMAPFGNRALALHTQLKLDTRETQ